MSLEKSYFFYKIEHHLANKMDKLEVYVKVKIPKPKPSEISKLQNDLNNIPNLKLYLVKTMVHIVYPQRNIL